MATGSFDVSPGTYPIAGYADQALVYRYVPPQDGGQAQQDNQEEDDQSPYSLLPNIRCLSIDNPEGPDPPTARFRYVLDDAYAAVFGWPSQFEDVWPLDAQGPYIVQNDDRIVVADQNPNGSMRILFDGFAQVPQVDVGPRGQSVQFTATNVAIRCFDIPVTGRTQRDSSLDGFNDQSGESDLRTNLPTRFNPSDERPGSNGGFLPNAVPTSLETQDPDSSAKFPVFCDPLVPWSNVTGDPDIAPAYWTVGSAIRYLLMRFNSSGQWVDNPDLTTIDDDLEDYSPADGYQVMNPNNADTYVTAPVTIRDYDATNKPWPRVIADLLGYAGFYMRWKTSTGSSGDPLTELVFYRRDEFSNSPTRWVYLDDGVAIAESGSNVTGIKLARDSAAIVNAWQVESAVRQVEVSMILLPLFQPTEGDEQAPASNQFITANWTPSTSAATRRKYRWYGADELGEGHYGIDQAGNGEWRTGVPCGFAAPGGFPQLFPDDPQTGNPTFVERYRPGHDTLISTDSAGRPLRATLQILMPKEKGGTFPTLLDPAVFPGNTRKIEQDTFNFFDVPDGWDLLPDRLGIQVTVDDPRQWATGDKIGDGTSPSLPSIDGIGWWSNPDPDGKGEGLNFGSIPLLILTVTIDDDFQQDATANKRLASPTPFARFRVVDGRDHFKYTSVDPSSRYYKGDGIDPTVVRDDTDRSLAHANQLRSKYEFPPTAGTLTIPYITTYYNVGDQITRIDGRDVDLSTNAGAQQGEAPIYPWVVGVSWIFESDRQGTVLHLSDRRADANNSW